MTRLAEKIRVEPLEEGRLRRVEQAVLGVVAPIPPAPRRLRWQRVLVFAPAIAAAAIVLAFWRPSGEPRRVTVAPPPRPPEPTAITTGAEPVRVDLGDAVVEIGADSEATLRRADGGVLVDLATGAVDCEVAPRDGRPPFEVLAGGVRVTVVGTAFRVERGEMVRVSVTRGEVLVASASGERAVRAGESWSEATGVVALASRSPAPDEPRAEGTAVPNDDRARARARARAREPERDRPRTPARSGTPAGDRLTRAQALRAVKPPRRGPPSGLSASDRDAFEGVAEWEGIDPARAADWYRTIARRRRGAVASFALYSLAYLQSFELGLVQAGDETAGEYLRRFARGREVEAARLLRLSAACRRGGRSRCRAAAAAYLEHHPDGDRAEAAAVLAK